MQITLLDWINSTITQNKIMANLIHDQEFHTLETENRCVLLHNDLLIKF